MKLIDLIEKSDCLYRGDGSPEKDIAAAEKALSVKFSKEYRSYLQKYSVVGINGHQVTGISATSETHVVDSTEMGRRIIANVDPSWYVIEIPDIDGIVIWQNQKGEVIQTSISGAAKVVAKSLFDYLMNRVLEAWTLRLLKTKDVDMAQVFFALRHSCCFAGGPMRGMYPDGSEYPGVHEILGRMKKVSTKLDKCK